jgi:PadR family transcriptional regulator PadR
MTDVRLTVAVAVVLRVFLDDVSRPRYGYELMRLTGFPSGKLYPVLARLERAGWLSKEQEDIDPQAAGRPIRRMYRLSDEGCRAASHELGLLSERLQPPSPEQSLTPQPDQLLPNGGPT